MITRSLLVIVCVLGFINKVYGVDELKGRVAIITGGSKGIGKGIARLFAEEGAKVMIVSRTEKDLAGVAKEIRERGGECTYMVGDITKPEDMRRMAAEGKRRYGRIDILVHNAAGIYPPAPIEDMREEEWHEAIRTNLDGVFYAVKSVIPYMREAGYGRIVLTSSISGPRVGLPKKSHYTAAKGGMNGFAKSIAIGLAKYGITVNLVEPGNIATEGLKVNSEAVIRERVAPIPMKRLGTVEEVAWAHLFLASEKSRYITGQSVIVDGGQTLPETHYEVY